MSEHEFTINVTDLDASGREFRLPIRPAWLLSVLEDHEAKPAKKEGLVDVRASKSGSDVVVHGTFRAELVVPCARCLDPVEVPVTSEISVLFVPDAQLKAEGGDEDGDLSEADTLGYAGDTVVLDDLVRDELLLEIPMIPLCSEDCPGMSPAPGIQKEPEAAGIDPRLAPLLGFSVAKQTRKN